MIDTGGVAVRAGIGKAGLSLVPISPSRRILEFTLGSDNRSSSTSARASPSGAASDLSARP